MSDDLMGCQTDSNSRPGLTCELCQPGSLTDGTALPFVLECLLYPAWPTAPHPSPPPLDSISDITAVEKLPQKPGASK